MNILRLNAEAAKQVLNERMTNTGARPTRFAGLRYRRTTAGWRVVDCHDAGREADVGALYLTRAELLADLDRYARETWGY